MTLKYIAIPAPACFDERVSPQQLRTLVIIAYYGSLSSREAFPSYNTLCKAVGISRRLLIDYIKHLCDIGYLEKKPRTRPDGSASSNVYHVPLNINIDFDAGEELASSKVGAAHGSDKHAAGVVKLDSTTPSEAGQHPRGEAGQHPSNNTSLNQKKKNIKKADVITLAEWETKQGSELCADMMVSWIKENGFDRQKVSTLVTEFRDVMKANGNVYADFKASFQNYVRRGYLSLGAAALKLPAAGQAVAKLETFDRGVSL